MLADGRSFIDAVAAAAETSPMRRVAFLQVLMQHRIKQAFVLRHGMRSGFFIYKRDRERERVGEIQ